MFADGKQKSEKVQNDLVEGTSVYLVDLLVKATGQKYQGNVAWLPRKRSGP